MNLKKIMEKLRITPRKKNREAVEKIQARGAELEAAKLLSQKLTIQYMNDGESYFKAKQKAEAEATLPIVDRNSTVKSDKPTFE